MRVVSVNPPSFATARQAQRIDGAVVGGALRLVETHSTRKRHKQRLIAMQHTAIHLGSDYKALRVPQLIIQVLVHVGFTITHRDRVRHRGAQALGGVRRGLFPLVALLVFIGALLARVFLAVVFALSTPVALLDQHYGVFASGVE